MDNLELLNQIDNPPPIPNSASRHPLGGVGRTIRAWSEAGEARSPPKTIFTGMNQFISIIIDTRNGRWKEIFLSGNDFANHQINGFVRSDQSRNVGLGAFTHAKRPATVPHAWRVHWRNWHRHVLSAETNNC
jgi:hypothetical protein